MKILDALMDMKENGTMYIDSHKTMILFMDGDDVVCRSVDIRSPTDFDKVWVCDLALWELGKEDWTPTDGFYLDFVEAMHVMMPEDMDGMQAIVSCNTSFPGVTFRYRNGKLIMNMDGVDTDEITLTPAHIKGGWKVVC